MSDEPDSPMEANETSDDADHGAQRNLPVTRRRRILRFIGANFLSRSVSEEPLPESNQLEVVVDDENEGGGVVDMEIIHSSEEDNEIEQENRLFEEYMQQADGPEERYNTELPDEHSYLGAMDAVRGLDYFECGKTYRIPIFEHHSFVFPGETLPMIWADTQFERNEYSNDGLTFGIVFLDPQFKQKIGVTCQVYERGVDAHGNITLKCRAHQRFILLKQPNGTYLIPTSSFNRRRFLADIRIQPEVQLPDPLNALTSNNLKKFLQNQHSSLRISHLTAMSTRWPKFVYDSYDIRRVMEKIHKFLVMMEIDAAPTDQVKLSFWLARNVPITEDQRYEIFITNSVTQRLLIIGKALDIVRCYFCCKRCNNRVASYDDLFAMSKQGQSLFCNPHGYVHETVTFTKIIENSSYVVDRPSTEFSWFPGYAWQILLCNGCHVHLGWKFMSTKKNLKPRKFYGLSGKSLTVESLKCSIVDEDEDVSQPETEDAAEVSHDADESN
ncbi:protein cereblon [Culicoides brevitarsis]|uniref:protein cereblon n=1 Tax=Culicoides brevitarsis TaxID=469753 RepID=UPI00307BBD3C